MKIAFTAAAMIVASGSAMAADGGNLDFNGLVQSATCKTSVVVGGTQTVSSDGIITLATATVPDISSTVNATSPGALPKEFRIGVNCSGTETKAHLTMGSVNYANANGTLNNNMNITVNGLAAAQGVNIAVHEVKTGGAVAQVKMGDASDIHDLNLDTNGDGEYVFDASYVKASDSATVTVGHVTTNGLYTIVYE